MEQAVRVLRELYAVAPSPMQPQLDKAISLLEQALLEGRAGPGVNAFQELERHLDESNHQNDSVTMHDSHAATPPTTGPVESYVAMQLSAQLLWARRVC